MPWPQRKWAGRIRSIRGLSQVSKSARPGVPAAIVLNLASGRERNATQDFSEASLAKSEELFMRGDVGIRVLHVVDHQHELVGVGALITVSADRGSDRPNSGITIYQRPGDVAEPIGCGCPRKARGHVVSGRIAPDVVGHA